METRELVKEIEAEEDLSDGSESDEMSLDGSESNEMSLDGFYGWSKHIPSENYFQTSVPMKKRLKVKQSVCVVCARQMEVSVMRRLSIEEGLWGEKF